MDRVSHNNDNINSGPRKCIYTYINRYANESIIQVDEVPTKVPLEFHCSFTICTGVGSNPFLSESENHPWIWRKQVRDNIHEFTILEILTKNVFTYNFRISNDTVRVYLRRQIRPSRTLLCIWRVLVLLFSVGVFYSSKKTHRLWSSLFPH